MRKHSLKTPEDESEHLPPDDEESEEHPPPAEHPPTPPPDEESWPPAKGVAAHDDAPHPGHPTTIEGVKDLLEQRLEDRAAPPPRVLSGPHHT